MGVAAESARAVSLELGGVRFSPERIVVLDRGSAVVRIARQDVREITLTWGFQAARPLVQAVLGFLCMACAGYGLVALIGALAFNGRGLIRVDAGLMTLSLLGGWLLLTAFHRGYYLAVTLAKSREKVPFARNLQRAEIEAFLERARRELGYEYTLGGDPFREPAPPNFESPTR